MAEVKTFRAIVKEAFTNTARRAEGPDDWPPLLAEELRALLRANGYAIHAADGRCVRLPGSELGREMSPEEMQAVGLGEAPPAEGEPATPMDDRTVPAHAEGRGS